MIVMVGVLVSIVSFQASRGPGKFTWVPQAMCEITRSTTRSLQWQSSIPNLFGGSPTSLRIPSARGLGSGVLGQQYLVGG